MVRLGFACVCIGALLASSCGEDEEPVDATGMYSINITNRENGCEFENWVVGETASNVAVTVTQDESNATATVEGITGGWLNLVFGTNQFVGNVVGRNLELVLSSRPLSEGNCAYTVNATLDANLNGDILEGEIRYTLATNDNPDCASLDEECVTRQEMNGARPPQ